jgi:hypothetical protein
VTTDRCDGCGAAFSGPAKTAIREDLALDLRLCPICHELFVGVADRPVLWAQLSRLQAEAQVMTAREGLAVSGN